jgi:transposase
MDLRERVVRAVQAGTPRTEVAERFEVGLATVGRYIRQQRSSGSLAAKKHHGPKLRIGLEERHALLALLQTWPDATLAEHCERWDTMHGVRLSEPTMSRAIRRLGWTRKKKTLRESERDEEALAAWLELAGTLDVGDLVFVDECGVNIAMTRLYSRAPKGRRAVGSVPSARGPNITLIASLSLEGIGAALTLEGAATAQVVEAYGRQMLAPILRPGQVVILDNCSIHKGDGIAGVVEDSGCSLLFLPTYSAGLSPIDEAFSKIKGHLRKVEARTQEALDDAVRQAIDSVTAEDALGWFTHCGYLPQ